ncbi:hypothetical protein ASPZODRAFT_13991 [Penicilliopsis zonata CBS 506.65]|uniref:Uncharacterized protein n=1 Tax=Penicilliopsis zonata CBS 506.65 TaxID=1073090 RepID=A0A1L9SQ72_9EURO|nr:hypothetical protein ASPZODRAFT_13991 [Penicilliopsis zonata CBS 506.65]OJJ49266.1 hypothetical protein ASPZODRAFT_13991 [Penicilliopsis zonata CBS 506.65]
MASLGGDGLFGTRATTSKYEYQNIDHFTAMQNQELELFEADHTRRLFIIFFNVTERILKEELANNTIFPFESYFFRDKVLIIKIESRAYATAHERLDQLLLIDRLHGMGGLDKQLYLFGAAHVEGNERVKRADKTYLPKKLPKGRSRKWPTLVIEVGDSESYQKLVSDVAWWQSESQGDVQIVLTVGINQQRKEITF